MSRWQPKRWPAPKSRRTREDRAAAARGMDRLGVTCLILKNLYPQHPHDPDVRPEWATLAYGRGWMTMVEFYDVEPLEFYGPRRFSMRDMYDQFPMPYLDEVAS